MIVLMNWMTVFVMTLVLGCGSKKEEPKVEKEPEKEKGWGDRLGGLADKAKAIGNEVGEKAKEIGSEVGDKATELGKGVESRARDLEIEDKARAIGGEVARRAEGLSQDALSLGKDLKAKLATGTKFAKYNYDLSIDAQAESDDERKARLSTMTRMKQLGVGDYEVAYARRAAHPLGQVYTWQFMFAWKLADGRTARLSIFTDDELEELVLAAMMGELLPIAGTLLK